MTVAELSAVPAKSSAGPVPLSSLPKPGLARLAAEFPRLARPGAHRLSLLRGRERFRVDLPVPGVPQMMVTSSPDDARAVFADRGQDLSISEMLRRFTLHDELFHPDLFIFKEGEEHLEDRRKASPALHGEALKSYEGEMARIARECISGWPVHREAPMLRLGYQVSLEVMLSVLLGMSSPERTARLRDAMLRYCSVTQSPGFGAVSGLSKMAIGRAVPYPPLHRAAAAADAIVLEEIAERRARPSEDPRADCLTMFLTLNELEEVPRTDEFIAATMRAAVLAGYETTGVTLGWIAEFLAHHPEVLAEAHHTVDAGEHAYIDAVILEVMRMRPALPMTGRIALRDTEINGVMLPKGAAVFLAMVALHEREDIYPDPMRFDPSRFVGTRPGTSTWLTFGGGAHRCLGGSFALFEARVLLRELLRLRTFVPESGPPVRPRVAHALLLPAFGAKATLVPRAAG